MKIRSSSRWLALSSILLSGSAFAATQSVNVQLFNPSTSDHFVVLEDGFRSEWPKTAKFYFGANYNFVQNPLIATSGGGTGTSFSIIDSIQSFDMFVGTKVANNFGVFAAVPIHYVSFSGVGLTGPLGTYSNDTSIGDIKLMGKIRLTNDTSNTSVALIPEVRISTGGTGVFVSDGSTYVSLRGSVERVFDSWTMIVNLGYVTAANSYYSFDPTYEPIDFRKRFIAGVGGYLPFNDTWGMNVELNTVNMIPFDKNNAPNDFYLGGRYGDSNGLAVTAGIDISRIGGAAGQDFRGIAGIRYTIFEADTQAPQPLSPTPAASPAATSSVTQTPPAATASPAPAKPVALTPPAVPAPAKTAPAKPAPTKPVTAPVSKVTAPAKPLPSPAKKK